ncbi:DMT family transporter [Haloactinomyces albus]|uniref:Drug/metabolite transporter (DMT)-like permease n=1 Tax=Haloactinomyces albus TaxID=1352928 RepID=A0AAE4CPC3_9ACTN|nr:DMT family transporter [Haloactinomyces albus]MDR7304271.1 drug/metabolite transporter (DMT)-like permease [Haloactinomyces albus]
MWVLVLALLAAALSALSAAGEQRAASQLAGTMRRGQRRGVGLPAAVPPLQPAVETRLRTSRRRVGYGVGFVIALLTSPLWLSSWLLDACGFFLQAAALHVGSISAVQPLMVTTLLFSLPLAALGTGRRPGRGGWIGASMICAGLALVLSTRALPATDTIHRVPLLATMGTVILVAAVLVLSGRNRAPVQRAALLSVAAGALFAVGAAVTKLAAATFATTGFTGLLTSWPGYTLAAVSLASFSLQQAAYASGPLAPSVTAIVITDPLVAYVLGVAGFGESLPRTGGTALLLVSGAIILGFGVALLAHSPLLARRSAH